MPKIIIASGPVIVENEKVLLNQHGDTDFWKFCGGRMKNLEESLEKTAKREVKEEMGIEIEILDLQPFITSAKKDEADVILVHFLAKRIGKIQPGEDIREWKWISLEDLPKENLGPNIIPALKHFGFLK